MTRRMISFINNTLKYSDEITDVVFNPESITVTYKNGSRIVYLEATVVGFGYAPGIWTTG